MRYVLILALLLIPFVSRANGAGERYVDGVLVELSAAPLSPLQGEQVGFILSFLNPTTRKPIDGITNVRWRIDAFDVKSRPNGGAVFESNVIPLAGGATDFVWRFQEAGIYDIHILFETSDGKKHEAGFLTSVRAIPVPLTQTSPLIPLAAIGAFAFVGGYAIAQLKMRRV